MAENEKPAESHSELGEVNEPERIAAEDAVGAQEQPTERQQERERAIADEPIAESEQRIAEATGPLDVEDSAAAGVDEVVEDDDGTPPAKPEIPGADLTPDIVFEGDDPLGRGEIEYDEEGEPIAP